MIENYKDKSKITSEDVVGTLNCEVGGVDIDSELFGGVHVCEVLAGNRLPQADIEDKHANRLLGEVDLN